MLVRWIDVDPNDWFYRSVIEASRIYLDPHKEKPLFEALPYNQFYQPRPRQVYVFNSEEGQTEFKLDGFKPLKDMRVFVFIDGVPIEPAKQEEGKIHLPNPVAGDREVVVWVTGVPHLGSTPCDPTQKDCLEGTCREYPRVLNCSPKYPSADLSQKDNYVFDIRYSLNEVAILFGKKLKRVNVQVREGETVQKALERAIGLKDDCFTIINGTIYVSYNLNGFPISVNYNYFNTETNMVHNLQGEKVIPESNCALYTDRFFPDIYMTRAQFFVVLQRMRENLYNRYTDRGYKSTHPDFTERPIKDKATILKGDYAEDVLNILDEKFLDGCYVFPLYEDGTFDPERCITRAEAVVYLHRFIEWALERFR